MREWYAYNTFVRKRYLRFLQRLPSGIMAKDKIASFPSVLDLFTHVLDVYKSWLVGFYETGEDTKLLERLSFKDAIEMEMAIEMEFS